MGKKNITTKVLSKRTTKYDLIILVLILAFFSILPLIMSLTSVQHIAPLKLDSGDQYDVFTYYKFIWLIIGTTVLLLIFLLKVKFADYKIWFGFNRNVFVGLFLSVVLSGFFAQYKSISFLGRYNLHEGTLSFIMYLFLFLIAANISYTERRAKWIFYLVMPLILVNFILSISDFYGFSILKSSFLSKLLLNSGEIQYNNSTLLNPNVLSGIAAMLTILFLTRACLINEGKKKILNLIISSLGFVLVVTSLATSGFITVILSLPLVLVMIFLTKKRKNNFVTFGIALSVFMLIFLVINQHNTRVTQETIGLQKSFSTVVFDSADFTSSNQEFNLPPLGISAGSGRLYIWQETIKLIKKRPLFGYGMDTLAYYFPQDDPLKASGMFDPTVNITKPHNLYLGLTFGAGIFALLAFVLLLVKHFWLNIKTLRNGINGERKIIIACLFTSWCAYLLQGLFNDSMIGVTPIFWIYFGASLSMLRTEIAENQKR